MVLLSLTTCSYSRVCLAVSQSQTRMATADIAVTQAPGTAEFKTADVAASTDVEVELVDKLPSTESPELVKKWGFTLAGRKVGKWLSNGVT